MILNNGLLSRAPRFTDHGDLGGKQIAEAVKAVIPMTPAEILRATRIANFAKARAAKAAKRAASGL